MVNIVVAVKHVSGSADETVFEDDLTIDRTGSDGHLSELDEYAVEQALVLKDHLGDGATVTALTVGPAGASDALAKALQMGADDAVHVCDDAIAGSDALGTAVVLAAAIGRLQHDVVVFGIASTDGWMGVIPSMVSELLELPVLSRASEVTVAGQTVRVRRDDDTESRVLEADMPLLVSVTDQSGEPRYPSFKGIMAAKKKPVLTWSLPDLGVDDALVGAQGSCVAVMEVTTRPPRGKGVLVTDESGSGAAELVDFLSTHKFV